MSPDQLRELEQHSGGSSMPQLIGGLLNAYDEDAVESRAQQLTHAELQTLGGDENLSIDEKRKLAQRNMLREAARPFTGKLNSFLNDVRRVNDQVLDIHTADRLEEANWQTDADDRNQATIKAFTDYLSENRDEIEALQLLFGEPYRRQELTLRMIKELNAKLRADQPTLAPQKVWEAYQNLGTTEGTAPEHELIALLSLVPMYVVLMKC